MKKPPITNFERFKKNNFFYATSLPNIELFFLGSNTHHYQCKNYLFEGIEIVWEGNPFELDFCDDNYLLDK